MFLVVTLIMFVMLEAQAGLSPKEADTPPYYVIVDCAPDAARHCKKNIDNPRATTDCMCENYDKLSPRCKRASKNYLDRQCPP